MTTTNEHAESWVRLLSFLESEETLTIQEIEARLKAEGVDTDAFLSRMERTVRQSIQAEWRREAEEERKGLSLRQNSLLQIGAWPISQVRAWLQNAMSGDFGPQAQEMACAYHRNKEDGGLSDEDLRSWVADIQSVLANSRDPHDT